MVVKKLDLQKAREIREHARKGIDFKTLGRMYDVHPATIKQVVTNVTFKDVPPPKGSKLFSYRGGKVYVLKDGRVWSLKRKKFLKPFIDSDGYHMYSIGTRVGGKSTFKTFGAHWLVLYCFKRPPRKNEVARHYHNPDRSYNHIDNLRWGTHQDNEDDKKIHGTRPVSTEHGGSVFDSKTVIKIRNKWNKTSLPTMKFCKKYASLYNVSTCTVYTLINNKTYKDLTV